MRVLLRPLNKSIGIRHRCFLLALLLLNALAGCAAVPQKATKAPEPRVGTVIAPDVVQSLQRQVRERDRRIEELTSQLEALKRIELETEASRQSNRRSLRIPAEALP
jgi:hypothetical protein